MAPLTGDQLNATLASPAVAVGAGALGGDAEGASCAGVLGDDDDGDSSDCVLPCSAGGVAWVEPAYADPAGAASPAFHVWLGSRADWNQFTRPDDRLLQVLPYDPAEDRDLVGDALDWFAGWLKAEGRSWAQERERVRALVADELA